MSLIVITKEQQLKRLIDCSDKKRTPEFVRKIQPIIDYDLC